MKRTLTRGLAALACALVAHADVVVQQNLVQKYGWNAVYVEVAPTQSPDEVFADLNGGEAAWNPENTKAGTVEWTLTKLLRQGPITLVGDMSVKRISSLTEITLQ